MSDAVIAALITGAVSLIGIAVSYWLATKKVQRQLEISQKVMENELQHIKENVKEHNHYAKLFTESMPVVKEQIKVINHRIEDLENKE